LAADTDTRDTHQPPDAVRVGRLTLSHFRSWRALEIAPEGRAVALYGPNGAGKTNVLEAVSLLSPGRGLRRAPLAEMARRPEEIGWRVTAELQAAGRPVEVATQVDLRDGVRRLVEIDGVAESQAALGRLARVLWLTPAMDRLWGGAAADRRAFLDRAALSFEPEHGEVSLAYDKAMRERNRLLKEDRPDPAWLSALEAQMADSGAATALARARCAHRLTLAQESAKTLFPKAEIAILGAMESRLTEVIRAGGDALSESLEIAEEFRIDLARSRGRDAAAGRTLEGPHRSDLQALFAAKGQPAHLSSTGEQKALLISLVLANARALAEKEGAPILLLDEVAAHLDSGRRATLYAEIADLGAQAWMTGTGAELFEALDAGAMKAEIAEGPDGSMLMESES